MAYLLLREGEPSGPEWDSTAQRIALDGSNVDTVLASMVDSAEGSATLARARRAGELAGNWDSWTSTLEQRLVKIEQKPGLDPAALTIVVNAAVATAVAAAYKAQPAVDPVALAAAVAAEVRKELATVTVTETETSSVNLPPSP